jgi:hypothetical protein
MSDALHGIAAVMRADAIARIGQMWNPKKGEEMTNAQETEALLPPGFEALEPFVAYWARKTTDERWDQRARASMAEITAFYDAMYEAAEDAIAWLDRHNPIGSELSAPAQRLAELLLALAHAAIAVEMHRQSRSPHTVFPHGIRVAAGPWPLG